MLEAMLMILEATSHTPSALALIGGLLLLAAGGCALLGWKEKNGR